MHRCSSSPATFCHPTAGNNDAEDTDDEFFDPCGKFPDELQPASAAGTGEVKQSMNVARDVARDEELRDEVRPEEQRSEETKTVA